MKLFKKRRPNYIVIEGLDGSGKETTSRALRQLLVSKGFRCAIISFPMYHKWHSKLVRMFLSGRFGKDSKKVNPKLASVFYAIDRFFGWHFDVKKRYKDYDFIIFDRYVTSNLVYQSAKGEDSIDARDIRRFIETLEYKLLKLPKPNNVFVLDNSIGKIYSNMENRDKLDIIEADVEYMKNVDNNLKFLVILNNWIKISTHVFVDHGEMKSPYVIAEEMYNHLNLPVV